MKRFEDEFPDYPDIPPTGGTSPGSGTPPPDDGPGYGGISNDPSWPWPAWAKAIDSNPQAWRTVDGGNIYHKSTDKVYSQTGSFISNMADFLSGLRPPDTYRPPNGKPGDKWTDPATKKVWQYYANLGWMETTGDPKNPSKPGPTTPGPYGPPGTMPPGSPDPGDGPVGPPPDIQISPNWDPASGNWVGLPPPTNPGQNAGGSQGNLMPKMPGMGVQATQPYIGLSRQDGRPTGPREAFKPWGEPLGYLSQALRYGGTPDQYQMGGDMGMSPTDIQMMMAAQSAALKG